jgi:hypothetical protein
MRRTAKPKLTLSLACAKPTSPQTSTLDLYVAFDVCLKTILNGLSSVDFRTIDTISTLFFDTIFQIPVLCTPARLPQIFKIQVHIALFLYPTYDPDFFSPSEDLLQNADTLHLTGFVSALSRSMLDPVWFSPSIVCDLERIRAEMLSDGSQCNLLHSVLSHLPSSITDVVESASLLVSWVDRSLLMNVRLFERVRAQLELDQTCCSTKRLLIAACDRFGWDTAECHDVLRTVRNPEWTIELVHAHAALFRGAVRPSAQRRRLRRGADEAHGGSAR